MSIALVKVQLVRTPISGHPLGLRLKATMDNDGHPIFGPSFNKPFLIMEGSDHSTMTRALVVEFTKFIAKRGWTVRRYGELIEIVLSAGIVHYQDSKALRADKPDLVEPTQQIDLEALSPEERQLLLEQLRAQLNPV